MSKLVTASRFSDPDAAYLALVQARRNLTETQAAEFDSRLVLILANHVGDLDVLQEAIALAKQGARVTKAEAHPRRFPSGWLVVALLAASAVFWAVLFFVTLAHLRMLAGGGAPFDVRPFGYSVEEARTFLDAIGGAGRAYYLNPELILDSFYPPLYATAGVLTLWWLTMPGRLRQAPVPLALRWTLVAIPVVMACLDGVENALIARMIWTWPDLSPGLVALASSATRLKLLLAAFTEIAVAVLSLAALLRMVTHRAQKIRAPAGAP